MDFERDMQDLIDELEALEGRTPPTTPLLQNNLTPEPFETSTKPEITSKLLRLVNERTILLSPCG